MNSKKIIVAGGGTAGWLTALTAKYSLPECDVIVVESNKIGILGAGEGTTPNILGLLSSLEVNPSDFLNKTGGTLKSGIKFTNWSGDGDYYYHPFYSSHPDISHKEFLKEIEYDSNIYYDLSIFFETNKKRFHHDHILLEENKSSNIAFHFDAIKVAEYLKNLGIQRGIKIYNGEIKDVSLNNENIDKIIFSDGSEMNCDFVFDCTGFARFFIGKVFKSEWDDYSKYLKVDSAVPFFIPPDKKIPIYTEAISMKYGWIWKIPLIERFGCGYVFDSSYIDENQAKEEIIELLGFEPIWPRKDKGAFKFKSGSYKETWIGNCIAVGLSTGFVEPLEATSIAVSVYSLKKIFNDSSFEKIFDLSKREEYNIDIKKINDEILNYIYYHYITQKTDTEFWDSFKKIENAPDTTKNILKNWQNNKPKYSDVSWATMFSIEDWLDVGYGNNILNINLFKSNSILNDIAKNYGDMFFEKIDHYNEKIKNYDSHEMILERIKLIAKN